MKGKKASGNIANVEREKELVVHRTFNAPLEQVWQAWTQPELFKRWNGPKGFTCPVAEIDFREGGRYLNCMKSPDGQEFWSTGVYKEIVMHEKIVATDSFADNQGNVVHAEHYGMSKDLPLEMSIILTFKDQGDKTDFTLRHIGLPAGDIINLTRDSWNEAFDKLDDLLENYEELL